MFKIGLIAVALSLSFAVHAGNRIELVSSDVRFSMPAGFAVVGDIGDSQNMLIFRYGDFKGSIFRQLKRRGDAGGTATEDNNVVATVLGLIENHRLRLP